MTVVREETFFKLVANERDRYPTLWLAAIQERPAYSTKVEWSVDVLPGLVKGATVWNNYTQIVREPYDSRPVEEGSTRDSELMSTGPAVDRFLSAVETALKFGIPYRSRTIGGHTVQACGGYVHYLGRELRAADRLALRVLRSPRLYRFDEYESPRFEWLAEFSLEVVPGQ